MDPSLLIPVPDPIPVHYSWFNIFNISTFFLHIIFVNSMLGMCIIALVKSFKTSDQNILETKEISLRLPFLIAFAINFGVAPLLFVQVLYGNFIYTSSVLMGWYWLMIIPILIMAYYGAYIFDFKFDALKNLPITRLMIIGMSTILFLAIGFLFVNNLTLMQSPEKWLEYFSNSRGTILNLTETTLIPRFLHFIAASIAVGGLFIAAMGKIKVKKEDNADYNHMIVSGMHWFSFATSIQIIIGIWFLMSLPNHIMLMFMGQNSFASFLLILSLGFTMGALFSGFSNKVWLSIVMSILVILPMVLMRDIVRSAYLEPYFSFSDLVIKPQYSSLVLFLISAIIGISLIVYMLQLAARSKKEV
jgi:hypothetical protein